MTFHRVFLHPPTPMTIDMTTLIAYIESISVSISKLLNAGNYTNEVCYRSRIRMRRGGCGGQIQSNILKKHDVQLSFTSFSGPKNEMEWEGNHFCRMPKIATIGIQIQNCFYPPTSYILRKEEALSQYRQY